MKIYQKLITARNLLQALELKKSGHNKFAGYQYFELADFLPHIQSIFLELGLVDIINFNKEMATMTIICCEDGSSVNFTSPMGTAQLKGCHEVQNVGAVETYQRRYLYVTALAIVEHDALDASEPIKEQKITASKIVAINQLIADTNSDLAKLLEYFKVDALVDMTLTQADQAIKLLEKKVKNDN